jgi:hypothetical protein
VDFPKDSITYEGVLNVYGGKQVLFTVKGDAVADYVRSQLNGFGYNDSVMGADSSFKEGNVEAIIDSDGNLTECTTEIAFNIKIDRSSCVVIQRSVVSNIKAGKTKIDFPPDLESYKKFAF